MKNAYLRNIVISAAAHAACMYILVAYSIGACRARRPLKDMAVFVDFQPAPPPVTVTAPEDLQPDPVPPEAADVPEPPEKKLTKPAAKKPPRKPKIAVSTNIIRRAAAPAAKRPAKKLTAAQIRKMLEPAAAGAGASSGEAVPYGWYLAQVRGIMYDAWQQPSALAGQRGLVARVLVRVRRDGRIVQAKMLASSGNGLMDKSVLQAVESVQALPELPFGFGGSAKDITIDFELEDGEL